MEAVWQEGEEVDLAANLPQVRRGARKGWVGLKSELLMEHSQTHFGISKRKRLY